MRDQITGRFLPGPLQPLIERFWAKVQKSDEPDGCWLWMASTMKAGYGALNEGGNHGKILYAHRFSYELHKGPITGGLIVCHSCDIKYPKNSIEYRRCVNPVHLFLGTDLDNVRDMDKKGRRVNTPHRGSEHGQAKLTEANVTAIWELHGSNTATTLELARQFKISRGQVQRITKSGKWGSLQRPSHIPQGKPMKTNKLTEDQVKEIRRLYNAGSTKTDLSRQFNISLGAIVAILNGTTWKHLL